MSQSLVQDYKARMRGCKTNQTVNNRVAWCLYVTTFVTSAAVTIATAVGFKQQALVATLAVVPGIVTLALAMFKPDARAQWWWAKYGKLDDLVQAMERENKTEADASKELREFLAAHEPKYPGLGAPPSGAGA